MTQNQIFDRRTAKKRRSSGKRLKSDNTEVLRDTRQSLSAPYHPGRLLREDTLPGQNWDAKTFATKLNVSVNVVNDILNESAPVTELLSERIGELLGISKKFFIKFQRSYDMEIIDKPIRMSMKNAGIPLSIMELEQQRILLMAFSFTEQGAEIGSIHAQKIMFLIDKEVDRDIGVPFFDHVQYKRGPNDHAINAILNNLIEEKFLKIVVPNNELRKRKYILNESGRSIGQKLVGVIPPKAMEHMKEIVEWSMSMHWTKLKNEIYKKYPEMNPDIDSSV